MSSRIDGAAPFVANPCWQRVYDHLCSISFPSLYRNVSNMIGTPPPQIPVSGFSLLVRLVPPLIRPLAFRIAFCGLLLIPIFVSEPYPPIPQNGPKNSIITYLNTSPPPLRLVLLEMRSSPLHNLPFQKSTHL